MIKFIIGYYRAWRLRPGLRYASFLAKEMALVHAPAQEHLWRLHRKLDSLVVWNERLRRIREMEQARGVDVDFDLRDWDRWINDIRR